MAWAARKSRISYELDDCGGPFAFVYAPVPDEPYIDAMSRATHFSDYEEDERAAALAEPWRCVECNQRWPGEEFACGYCGHLREGLGDDED